MPPNRPFSTKPHIRLPIQTQTSLTDLIQEIAATKEQVQRLEATQVEQNNKLESFRRNLCDLIKHLGRIYIQQNHIENQQHNIMQKLDFFADMPENQTPAGQTSACAQLDSPQILSRPPVDPAELAALTYIDPNLRTDQQLDAALYKLVEGTEMPAFSSDISE